MDRWTETEDLTRALEDAGFECAEIERFLECVVRGELCRQRRMLADRRARLLEGIHLKEKQVGCIDYIAYHIDRRSAMAGRGENGGER